VSIPAFDVGDRIRLGNSTGTNSDGTARDPFRDVNGSATDPTAVSLQLIQPDGTLLVYNWPNQGLGDGLLLREALGRFYWDVTLSAAGRWRWKLSGTGAVETSEEGELYVRWSPFA
jgi:hypothetical protein